MLQDRPREHTSPLEKLEHHEINMSAEIDQAGINFYHSMMGSLQWAVLFRPFETKMETMSMTCLHNVSK
jgi:hypothetical protein